MFEAAMALLMAIVIGIGVFVGTLMLMVGSIYLILVSCVLGAKLRRIWKGSTDESCKKQK